MTKSLQRLPSYWIDRTSDELKIAFTRDTDDKALAKRFPCLIKTNSTKHVPPSIDNHWIKADNEIITDLSLEEIDTILENDKSGKEVLYIDGGENLDLV